MLNIFIINKYLANIFLLLFTSVLESKKFFFYYLKLQLDFELEFVVFKNSFENAYLRYSTVKFE